LCPTKQAELAPTQFFDFDAAATQLGEDEPEETGRRLSVSLFWRTFFLLSVLLLGCMLAWLQTLKSLQYEAHSLEVAKELASQVNLSRAALQHSDAIARVALLKVMREEEGLRIVPREPSDVFVLRDTDSVGKKVTLEVTKHLGPGAMVATSVNGRAGLWVGFQMEGDPYWLLAEHEESLPAGRATWLIWLALATSLSLAGAALIARLINRPLKELSFAASRVREGRFEASQLDERVPTSEIRDVNIGFNRMAHRLAKIEQDRVMMLAGISHDLRTPLARLRLEAEMSVADTNARAHMVADIEQLDAIIDKFLDYARPVNGLGEAISLRKVVDSCAFALQGRRDVRLMVDVDASLSVRGDAVELGRVISNLLENACRYGKTPNTGVADIRIAATQRDDWVLLKIRDHGVGAAPEQLLNLLQPFYRGEAARTAANGAGLGLAIVDKTVRRMGGSFAISNAPSGGLSANIRLHSA
jgi:two-component system osmolarity sensor histidine kinase EnvZ